VIRPPYFQKKYRYIIRFFGEVADKSTVIDPQTAEHIELMTCLGDKKSKLSLFGVMNHCVTKGEDQKPSIWIGIG
jgi:hypothetical protein